MKEIRLTKHAFTQINNRGIKFNEIHETIFSSNWNKTKHLRFLATKVFNYNQNWEDEFYTQKEVKVIFKVEDDKIIVITAIARYFK